MEQVDYDSYLRTDRIPHLWCPGCGHGIALKAIIRSIHAMGWKKDEIVMISGIGCSGRTPGYVDLNTLHTTHGRAIAFATGVKLANPKLKVIVVMGDGDGIAIGGNHLIHAARRNLDINVLLFNNFIYGMTGGQLSPTTPLGCRATTAPFGNLEHAFDIAGMIAAAGGNYVARSTVYHAVELNRLIQRGFERKGFCFVEVMTPCPTAFGRKNNLRTVAEMMYDLKNRAISRVKAERLSEEELENRFVTGVLVDRNKIEYSALYSQLVQRLRGA